MMRDPPIRRPSDSLPIQSIRGHAAQTMCRNIKTLYNFQPPATEEEIRASAVQFVRKISGMRKPSKDNQPVFDEAIEEVVRATTKLLDSLSTKAPPRDREREADKARRRWQARANR